MPRGISTASTIRSDNRAMINHALSLSLSLPFRIISRWIRCTWRVDRWLGERTSERRGIREYSFLEARSRESLLERTVVEETAR